MSTGPTDDTPCVQRWRACPGTAAARPITTRTESAIASATSAVPPTRFPCRNARPPRYNGRGRNRDTSRRRGREGIRTFDLGIKRSRAGSRWVSAGSGKCRPVAADSGRYHLPGSRLISVGLVAPRVAPDQTAGQTGAVAVCPACGKENPEGFHFCGFCTAPLAVQAGGLVEVRKTVTLCSAISPGRPGWVGT